MIPNDYRIWCWHFCRKESLRSFAAKKKNRLWSRLKKRFFFFALEREQCLRGRGKVMEGKGVLYQGWLLMKFCCGSAPQDWCRPPTVQKHISLLLLRSSLFFFATVCARCWILPICVLSYRYIYLLNISPFPPTLPRPPFFSFRPFPDLTSPPTTAPITTQQHPFGGIEIYMFQVVTLFMHSTIRPEGYYFQKYIVYICVCVSFSFFFFPPRDSINAELIEFSECEKRMNWQKEKSILWLIKKLQ